MQELKHKLAYFLTDGGNLYGDKVFYSQCNLRGIYLWNRNDYVGYDQYKSQSYQVEKTA